MKKLFFLPLLTLLAVEADAQNLLKKLGKEVGNAVKKEIVNKLNGKSNGNNSGNYNRGGQQDEPFNPSMLVPPEEARRRELAQSRIDAEEAAEEAAE